MADFESFLRERKLTNEDLVQQKNRGLLPHDKVYTEEETLALSQVSLIAIDLYRRDSEWPT